MTPKISVIVPVYNVESYISHCLESILSQSLKELEIICVNDGSTDGSLSLLEQYSKKDKRIKVFDKINEGSGEARNYGLKQASGTYIGFVDADDWIDTEMYRELCEKIEKNACEVVMCEANIFDENLGKIIEQGRKIENLPSLSHLSSDDIDFIFNCDNDPDLLFKLSVSPCNKLYKRDFLMEKNIWFPKGIFEDNVFFFQVFLNAKKNLLVRKKFYFQRINRKGSNVTLKDRTYYDIVPVFSQIEKLICDKLPGSFDGFLNYKINGFCKRFEQIGDEFKEVFFQKIQDDLSKITHGSSKNLSQSCFKIYNNITNSKNYYEYQLKQVTDNLEYKHNKIVKEKDKIIKEKDRVIKEKLELIRKIKSSTSWKITEPMRFVSKILKKN